MPNVSPRDWPRPVLTAASLISAAVLVGFLYWAQVILLPIALATLITFLLSPLVTRLHYWGLPRIPAVIAVVLVAGVAVTSVAYVVTLQVADLAAELPSYRGNIKEKLSDVRGMMRGGVLERLQLMLEDITRELEEEEEQAESAGPTGGEPTEAQVEEEPVPVEVKPEESALGVADTQTLAPVLEGAATAGLVIVLVIFMLIKREDLRNRVVSMAGQGSLATTTKALDEAGKRISRYLLMQFIINATYGLAVGVGLFVLGVPYAVLWGLSAAVLRYIPYVGPWLAALLPIGLSLIHSPGWTQVFFVIGLFVVLELLSNNVMEPWLYGQSVGLSEVAVILAAVFWAWLWGPLGLVLSTPMTVCFVVLGKYLPALSFLDRLLGERPALKPYISFYQRLLARDEDEAAEIAEQHAEEFPLETTCDELLLPTLSLVQRDRAQGQISEEDEAFVLDAVEEILDELVEQRPEGERAPAESERETPRKAVVIGFPARDRADELALQMLGAAFCAECDLEILSSDALISENISRVEESDAACVCLMSVPPGDLAQARQICKKLRARFPDLRIVAGRLGARGISEKSRDMLLSAGADRALGTLADLRQTLLPIVQFRRQAAPTNGHAAAATDGASVTSGQSPTAHPPSKPK